MATHSDDMDIDWTETILAEVENDDYLKGFKEQKEDVLRRMRYRREKTPTAETYCGVGKDLICYLNKIIENQKVEGVDVDPTIFDKETETRAKLIEFFQEGDVRGFFKVLLDHPVRSSFIPIGEVAELKNSFSAPYVGDATKALHEYITKANEMFHVGDPLYYAKFFFFVQASGTGKTRTLTELWKHDVIVIYICLRSEKDNKNFPPRDVAPANFLLHYPSSGENYERRCQIFLEALFETVKKLFTQIWFDAQFSASIAAKAWNDKYGVGGNLRELFFQLIDDNCKNLLAQDEINAKLAQDGHKPAEEKTKEALQKQYDAYDRLLQDPVVAFFLNSALNTPKIVVSFDEAQDLSELRYDYKPAYHLCRAISRVSVRNTKQESIWFIFTSTNSKITQFSPPAPFHDSQRVSVEGHLLFGPFTLTGWDQYAPQAGDSSIVDIKKVGTFDYVVGFGRPLWRSLGLSDSYRAFNLAKQKLVHGPRFDGKMAPQALAILGQRFCLEIVFGHYEATLFHNTAVASYMRICLSVTVDRMWLDTGYPSEPLLSSAAAAHLHQNLDTTVECVKHVVQKIHSGLISRGAQGELVSRILLLLGRDYATEHVKSPAPPSIASFSGPPTHHTQSTTSYAPSESVARPLPYCGPVKLIHYLTNTFGDNILPEAHAEIIRELFSKAYINATHWVSMDKNILHKQPQKNEISRKDWLLALWARSSAVQCAHPQPGIDKLIPIYFDDDTRKNAKDRMSTILVSDKLTATSNQRIYTDIYPTMKGVQCGTGLPSVAILCDMGVQGVAEARYNFSRKCLQLYIPGVSKESYHFLKSSPGLEQEMQNLVDNLNTEPYSYPIGKKVENLFKFSKEVSKEYVPV